MLALARWAIHLKDGKTLTDKDCYPHEVDQEEITSIERIEGDLIATIMKSSCLTSFFVKTSASQDINPFEGGTRPVQIEERIVGAFLPPQERPVRLELIIVPGTRNVKLRVLSVNTLRKDGL